MAKTGGVAPKKKKKGGVPKVSQQPVLPPWMSYDPAIGGEIRSTERGLKDILADTSRAQYYADQDYGLKTGDITTDSARGYEDLARSYARGAEDLNTRAARGEEDFQTRLTGLIRDTQTQGREQRQAANAAGVLPGSASRAAAARRSELLKQRRQPLDTGRQRMQQDTSRGLQRLTENTQTAQNRLYEDTGREMNLAQIDYQRTGTDLTTKRNRGIREGRIGKLDLTNQAIFDARSRKPGSFSMYGQPKKKKKR